MSDKLIATGEEKLLYFFRTDPTLRQVGDDPRLPEIIRMFIEVAKAAPTIQPPTPGAPPA